jgi:2-(1,2-epoxy-1,2-dihydrophenyl)acetyl-CoA isomerase
MADLETWTIDRVRVARLNRPEKKNALSEEMMSLLREALATADEDPQVGCFVLTGAGDAFCSGGDLGRWSAELVKVDPTPLERRSRLQNITHRVALEVEQFRKPLVAAVNGAAVGAGMDLALMCDLRVASESARFSEGYIRVGLLPGNGGCYYLPRIVGLARALELLWTADFVEAEEALRLGLVNRVIEGPDFLDGALAYAQRLASGPPIQMSDIKRLVYQSQRTDLRTSLDSVAAHMAVVQSTADYKEAIQA